MHTTLLSIFMLSQATVVVGLGCAASSHEMQVGAQQSQFCAESVIDITGRFLRVDPFKLAPTEYSPNADAIIVSA